MMSFKRSVECGVIAFETDVQLRYMLINGSNSMAITYSATRKMLDYIFPEVLKTIPSLNVR